MKKSIVIVAVVATVALALTAFKSAEKERIVLNKEQKVISKLAADNVDIASSVLTWKGSKPTGSHNGTVALKSGNLEVAKGKIKSGVFVVDLYTIKCLDLAGSDGAANLEGHLKGEDFFDVAKYPTSTFTITSTKSNGKKVNVTGKLQIKDVTKTITIPAVLTTENGVISFTSEVFTINRADFNVKYGSKSFFDNLKDKFIDDTIEMSFVVKVKV